MFTQMDLSVDGEFVFPLISSAEQVVGEVKIVVASGMALATYELSDGVKTDEDDEFFTFFPDIAGVNELRPARLRDVKLEFGTSYAVSTFMNTDNQVLLYVNFPVTYKKSNENVDAFSYEDTEYLLRVMELVKLMD